MKKISTLVGRDARWIQPRAFKMEYELRAGDELVARLHIKSSFKGVAVGESADGSWEFKRAGTFSHTTLIRDGKTSQELGSFRSSWKCSGGTLELAGGRTFRVRTNLWMSRFTITRASEEPLVEFKPRGCIHHSSDVVIARSAASMPELPLFVILGWYVAVMAQNDAAGAGAAVAAGG